MVKTREDRWHETRDAVLPELLVMRICDGDRDPEGTAILQANAVADRAHGQLETKARADDINNHSDDVNELVSSAGFLVRHLRHINMTRDDEEFIADVEAALKHFESE